MELCFALQQYTLHVPIYLIFNTKWSEFLPCIKIMLSRRDINSNNHIFEGRDNMNLLLSIAHGRYLRILMELDQLGYIMVVYKSDTP